MGGLARVTVLVVVMCGVFVWTGELLTSVSGSGGGGGGGEVGVDLGQAVFFGKGKCYTCHAIGGEGSAVRCPNLGVMGKFTSPIGVRAAQRKEGYSAIQYLVESLYDPNAFIVKGYTKGLMTPVHRPPIGLNDDQVASVVLYLLSASGLDAGDTALEETRQAQRQFSSAGGGDEAPPSVAFVWGEADTGREDFARLKCVQCHAVKGVTFEIEGSVPEGGVGPDLTSIGAIQTREYLFESLANPNAVIVGDPPGVKSGDKDSFRGPGGASRMPEFHATMTVAEALNMVEFMKALTDEKANKERFP